ncbi:MAG: phage baseplate assembly protein V [Kofleriaceae bacterium]
MSFDDVFNRLTEFTERWQRQQPQLGLAFAEVASVDDDGYTLTYLSGNHDAPSAPARVATFMAGGGRGAYFMPEVGDEVVVGFELGDLNRPVILGALWSDVDTPPTTVDTSASNNIRSIVSRDGHQITLDDTHGAGKVQIKIAGEPPTGGFEITIEAGPSPKINIKTTGVITTSRIVLDGVPWFHQHATGTGPSGPPLPAPGALVP